MPIAPWACTIQYNYNLYQVDFRGNSNWYMGSDNVNLDGPCLTMSYDSSAATNLAVTDSAGNPLDDDLTLNEGQNDIILQAEGLQADFPYYMEARFYYEGYLNHLPPSGWRATRPTAQWPSR